MGSKLKPCPFCGGKGVLHSRKISQPGMHEREHYVRCSRCGTFTNIMCQRVYEKTQDVKEAAVKAWNKRIADNELQFYKDAIQAICDKFEYISECNECPIRQYGVCPQSELTDEQKVQMQADFEAEMQRLQPELYQT